jgi:hypothetical protein
VVCDTVQFCRHLLTFRRVEEQVGWEKCFGVGMKENGTAVRANKLGDGQAETTKVEVEKMYV